MSELRLISHEKYQVKPLVEAALKHELGLLEVGIRQTERRLRMLEEKYRQPTADFVNAYEQDQFEETF
jgi:hypothetical protein